MIHATEKQSNYSKKLRDPRWQKLRLQVLERDGWACVLCGDIKSTLAVHHKFYRKGAEPWDYPLDTFMTLCESCHTAEYEARGGAEQRLLSTLREKGFMASDLDRFQYGFQNMQLLHTPEIVSDVYQWLLQNTKAQWTMIHEHFNFLEENDLDDNIPEKRNRLVSPPHD